jgi:hypothetical protein
MPSSFVIKSRPHIRAWMVNVKNNKSAMTRWLFQFLVSKQPNVLKVVAISAMIKCQNNSGILLVAGSANQLFVENLQARDLIGECCKTTSTVARVW